MPSSKPIKAPRIIYNDDTCSLLYVSQPHTKEKTFSAVDYLKDTQVDVLCWCMTNQVAYGYRSKKYENYYDKMFQKPTLQDVSFSINPKGDLKLSMYAQGIDYLPLLIDRTRENGMQFFASIRMNDCHHKSMPDGPITSEFWKKHQQYRLWELDDTLSYYNGLLDYSYVPVRKLVLGMIVEVTELYDIDGVELDMGREPHYFNPSEAWQKRGILTDFVKEIRQYLKKLSQKRGKKISLLIRMPFSEDVQRKGGMDVKTWIRRGYMDILAMNSKTCQNDHNQCVEPYLSLCRKAGIPLYGSIENGVLTNSDSYPSAVKVAHNAGVNQTAVEKINSQRAMAKNLLEQGVQGIHMFNYPCVLFEPKKYRPNTKATFDKLTSVLSEMGSLKTLAHADKEYYFFSELPIYAESNRPKEFHQTVPFAIFGRDTQKARKVTISFRQVAKRNPHDPHGGACAHKTVVSRGYVDYYLNGEKMALPQITIRKQPAGRIPSGFELDEHQLVEINVDPRQIKNGENKLAFEIKRFPAQCDPYVYFYDLRVKVVCDLAKKKTGR